MDVESSLESVFEFCAERRRKCLRDEGRMGNVDFFYAEHIRVRTKSRFSLGAKEKMYIRVGSSGLLCHVY